MEVSFPPHELVQKLSKWSLGSLSDDFCAISGGGRLTSTTRKRLVPRRHIVWFQDGTLSGSKIAQCLFPRQHIVWFQDSTLFGSKTAHCLVPRKHVVWSQDTQTYIVHKIWHERVRHGSPRAHIKSGRSYAFQDDFYIGLGSIFDNLGPNMASNRPERFLKSFLEAVAPS